LEELLKPMKNLYEIQFKHYAPRDSEQGIVTYLIAESNEEVFDWLKDDPELSDERYITTPFGDYEADQESYDVYDNHYNLVSKESRKDQIMRFKGDMNDPDIALDDLFYGKTLFGWKLVKEDVSPYEISTVRGLGISIHEMKV
jgi:hypothetical protein